MPLREAAERYLGQGIDLRIADRDLYEVRHTLRRSPHRRSHTKRLLGLGTAPNSFGILL
jgi:hypothetical protein